MRQDGFHFWPYRYLCARDLSFAIRFTAAFYENLLHTPERDYFWRNMERKWIAGTLDILDLAKLKTVNDINING